MPVGASERIAAHEHHALTDQRRRNAVHEFSVVKSLVERVCDELSKQGYARACAVRVRRSSAFSEQALREAFRALTLGTPLQDAELLVETTEHRARCSCGAEHIVHSDDLVGHMFVCPACGAVMEIDEHGDLWLLEVEVEEPGS
ncbi:MAG: hydrogenase maturation nickel metallochaperone HypA [Candidatus Hydrogenedentota bacterium]|jgi:Zn finger protein HypA/HybF involved in hydrogenase expression|nr:MAG: hydrogenase maturation nickel metallochaperone HypA [Candidatus Hydrogenedentota bacterium]